MRLRFGQRAGLGCLGLGLINLCLVLGPDDRGLAGEFGLLTLGLLLGLRGRLVRLGLSDLRLLLDGRVVGRGHRVDVAEPVVVDGLDLQGIDGEADPGHFLLGAVEHLGGELLAFPDDLLYGHRADDRPQVTGEDPAGKHGHLVLV